jgi:type II secretory pathway pseudopilin PulG
LRRPVLAHHIISLHLRQRFDGVNSRCFYSLASHATREYPSPNEATDMKEKGFILLADLLLTMLCMSIICAMAVPSIVQIRKTQEMVNAKGRVLNQAQVQGAIALCRATPGCSPSVGLTAQIPQVGTITQGAYVFTYWADGSGHWTYTAVAQGSVFSPTGNDYWTDTSGVLRCGDWPGGAPC